MSELFKNAPIVKVVMLRGEDGTATKLSELRNDMTFLTEQQIITLVANIVDTGEVGDIDTGFVTKLVEQNKQKALQFWVGTQAEYNAISEKTANMFYIITDDPFKADVNAAIAALSARINAIEIPDIEAELSQLQTDMQNLGESTEQTIQQLETDVAAAVANITSTFCYKAGDTDTISFRGCGYIGGTNYNQIHFTVPLRKIMPVGLTLQISSAQIGIREQKATATSNSAVTWVSELNPTFGNLTSYGAFLTIRYDKAAGVYDRYTSPTVGVSLDLSFTVTAVNE